MRNANVKHGGVNETRAKWRTRKTIRWMVRCRLKGLNRPNILPLNLRPACRCLQDLSRSLPPPGPWFHLQPHLRLGPLLSVCSIIISICTRLDSITNFLFLPISVFIVARLKILSTTSNTRCYTCGSFSVGMAYCTCRLNDYAFLIKVD